ncbi:peptide ABC transporter substrate-binding protein [Nocardia puris]|uniref:Oligopeptide transport system substrate-binding protein n=1 Tax=Nocardia puris TaxID=208602 RepID=A0A366DNG0_9NOCA|nr:ABC transporter substrate-binding protein [Nocardia puris]RBO91606.1 oligopeptide transport system substrate-binding protein [Nocardia puris]
MRTSRLALSVASLCIATALVATVGGCGSETTAPTAMTPTAADTLTLNTTEPENALVPGNTTDAGGSKILRTLFKGLVDYDPKTAAPRNAVAESIETTDSRIFTITLRPDWTFHDGTPVTARSFVDAWNHTAYRPNEQLGAGFLSVIDGFDAVHPLDPAIEPSARELRGLRLLDDHRFVVTLAAPLPSFATRLGHLAYAPLPAKFFDDRAGYLARPVGNGPFEFVSHTKGSSIVVARHDGYPGAARPSIERAEFRFNATLEAAYADVVANRLDFLEVLPGDALVGGRYKRDLAGRHFTREGTGLQSLTFPLYDPRFADPRVRQAISMAIDRQGVIDAVFTGDRLPADGLAPASVRGGTTGQCGDLCAHRPREARELFDSTGFQGPIDIMSNIDSANEKWLTAVCDSITAALDRECRFLPVPTLSEFRRQINGQQMTTLYRTGWVADYPSIENFLNPLYRTGGSSNTGAYSNPAVDELLARADSAVTDEQAWPLYQEAERLILRDMPAIPLVVPGVQTGWSDRLRDVVVTPFRDLDLETVTLAS